MILCSAEPRIISCLPTHVINLVINDNSLEILYIYIFFFFFFLFFFLVLQPVVFCCFFYIYFFLKHNFMYRKYGKGSFSKKEGRKEMF